MSFCITFIGVRIYLIIDIKVSQPDFHSDHLKFRGCFLLISPHWLAKLIMVSRSSFLWGFIDEKLLCYSFLILYCNSIFTESPSRNGLFIFQLVLKSLYLRIVLYLINYYYKTNAILKFNYKYENFQHSFFFQSQGNEKASIAV